MIFFLIDDVLTFLAVVTYSTLPRKKKTGWPYVVPWYFNLRQVTFHFRFEWSQIKEKERGWDGRKTKEKEVMHIVKTQFGLRSIAFRWEFVKGQSL